MKSLDRTLTLLLTVATIASSLLVAASRPADGYCFGGGGGELGLVEGGALSVVLRP